MCVCVVVTVRSHIHIDIVDAFTEKKKKRQKIFRSVLDPYANICQIILLQNWLFSYLIDVYFYLFILFFIFYDLIFKSGRMW